MSNIVKSIDKFHSTTNGRLTFGISELIVAYLLASSAVFTGSLWKYALAFLLVIGALNNIAKVMIGSKKNNGKSKLKAKKT